MSIANMASVAVASNHAQTTQAMANAMIRQQHSAEQAVVRLLEQAITRTANPPTAGSVNITV